MQKETTTTIITEKTRFSFSVAQIVAWGLSTVAILFSIIQLTKAIITVANNMENRLRDLEIKQFYTEERLNKLENNRK